MSLVEVTLQCNASEPFIMPTFQGLAVSKADPLAYFESGAYSLKAKLAIHYVDPLARAHR